MNSEKRVFLYVRVSTQEQVKEGYSIDEQIDRLKKYSEAHGWIIVKKFVDAGYSGGNTNRPSLQDMIESIRRGMADIVLVYKLDRLSRSQKDTLELIEDVFLANNCDFVSMNENFDTSTPFGRAMIGILAVFAQLEREQIKERMSMGREGRAKEGKYIGGGLAPIGYDYIDGELVINEFEAMQIRDLFDMYLAGASFKKIEQTFAEKGYYHKYGRWTAKRMSGIIQSRLYIGDVKFARNTYKGNHQAIVDDETFRKANEIKSMRSDMYSRGGGKKKGGQLSLLGGMIYCKNCGAKYGYSYSEWKGKRYKYYSCYSRRRQNLSMIKDPTCKNKTYRQDDLEQIIFDEIRKLSTDPEYITEIRDENLTPDDRDRERIIKKEIESIDTQRSRFLDLYGLGKYSMEELQKKTDPLDDRKMKLERELQSLRKSEMAVEEATDIISSFGDILDRGSFDEIRLTIETLIDRIIIDGDDIIIKWKFA